MDLDGDAMLALVGRIRRSGRAKSDLMLAEAERLLLEAATPKPAPDPVRTALENLTGAMRFVLAFYEPGQRHLDTEAWKCAEAGARAAFAQAETALGESK